HHGPRRGQRDHRAPLHRGGVRAGPRAGLPAAAEQRRRRAPPARLGALRLPRPRAHRSCGHLHHRRHAGGIHGADLPAPTRPHPAQRAGVAVARRVAVHRLLRERVDLQPAAAAPGGHRRGRRGRHWRRDPRRWCALPEHRRGAQGGRAVLGRPHALRAPAGRRPRLVAEQPPGPRPARPQHRRCRADGLPQHHHDRRAPARPRPRRPRHRPPGAGAPARPRRGAAHRGRPRRGGRGRRPRPAAGVRPARGRHPHRPPAAGAPGAGPPGPAGRRSRRRRHRGRDRRVVGLRPLRPLRRRLPAALRRHPRGHPAPL
ncbi:MAG: hypothetical protein AVDCRST_MAG35-1661, partial [uncultured Quadrisphaera sp.]